MDTDPIDQQKITETINFHGHWCPGLAIGIRAAEWALKEMGKSPDEGNRCRGRDRHVRCGCHPEPGRLYLWKRESDSQRLRQECVYVLSAQGWQSHAPCASFGHLWSHRACVGKTSP